MEKILEFTVAWPKDISVDCYLVTGTCDFMLKVEVANVTAFENLITNKLSKVEEIGNMQTLVILSQPKSAKITPIDYK